MIIALLLYSGIVTILLLVMLWISAQDFDRIVQLEANAYEGEPILFPKKTPQIIDSRDRLGQPIPHDEGRPADRAPIRAEDAKGLRDEVRKEAARLSSEFGYIVPPRTPPSPPHHPPSAP